MIPQTYANQGHDALNSAEIGVFWQTLNYRKVWKEQIVNDSFVSQLALIAKTAKNILYLDDRPIQNPSEWAKKEDFWTYLERYLPEIDKQLTGDFWCYFMPTKEGISPDT